MDATDVLENPFGASILSFVLMFAMALVSYELWLFIFSATVAYVASDILVNFVIHGGEGFAKIGWDNDFAEKGYAYIAFFLAIVISTGAIAWGLPELFSILFPQSGRPSLFWVLMMSLLAVEAVLGDLQLRFYER